MQEICKLEIVRQDKKSDWYEVRSSMRLVWLRNKQEIVPVEVICSFQLMHGDGPAGSANSIVNRLQRVNEMGDEPFCCFFCVLLPLCHPHLLGHGIFLGIGPFEFCSGSIGTLSIFVSLYKQSGTFRQYDAWWIV